MSSNPVWSCVAPRKGRSAKIDRHPVFERIMGRIPSCLQNTFSYDQLFVLAQATKPPPTRHWLDYRASIPFFGARYYITLFCGKERRQLERIKLEGQASVGKASLAYIILAWGFFSLLIAAFIVAAYVAKSVMGIDLLEGPSAFHGLIFSRS
jgi:hypothetical protein